MVERLDLAFERCQYCGDVLFFANEGKNTAGGFICTPTGRSPDRTPVKKRVEAKREEPQLGTAPFCGEYAKCNNAESYDACWEFELYVVMSGKGQSGKSDLFVVK